MPPRKYTKTEYDDAQKAEFCELAQIIGIGRAIRELGYPTYATAMSWMNARGIEPATDKIMQKMKLYHTYYQVDDLLMTVDNAIAAIEEMIATAQTSEDMQRLANALQKVVNTRQTLEGKASSIVERRETTQQDLEIAELLRAEQAKQEKGNEEVRTKHGFGHDENINLEVTEE